MKIRLLLLIIVSIFFISGCNKSEKEIFHVNMYRTDCVPIRLTVYNNKKYEVYSSFNGCIPGEECDDETDYIKTDEGKYKYDVLKIVDNSIDATDKTYDYLNYPTYEIYMGEDYIKDGYSAYYTIEDESSNKYLNEFLEKIGLDLNTCAKGIYPE